MKNNKGFAVVEGLLFFIIIAMIGFVAWYVMDANKETEKRLKSIENASVSTKSPADNQSDTLKISELGVQLKLPSSLQGMTYEKLDATSVTFHMPDLETLAKDCEGGSMVINTWTKKDGKATNELPGTGVVREFDNFYITREGSPAGQTCPNEVRDKVSELKQKYAVILLDIEKNIKELE